MTHEKCNTCRFWLEDRSTRDPNDEDFAWGACRIRAPIVVGELAAMTVPRPGWGRQQEGENLDTLEVERATLHPVTFATGWCGEFQLKAAADPAWDEAEATLAVLMDKLNNGCAGMSDEAVAPIATAFAQAQLRFVQLEPETAAQAFRQLEIATTDGDLDGADIPLIMARLKRLTGAA